MKISLSPDVERLIADQISSGRYQSADEVVREGLGLLRERESARPRSPSAPAMSLAADFESIAGEVPDSEWASLPPDLSKELDHYLYGTRKTL